jgi:hypothetical protein
VVGNAKSFAHAFGDALEAYLKYKEINHSQAAKRLGLDRKQGISRLGTYCHDSPNGERRTPSAEFLYLICSTFPDFEFEYNGLKISALTTNGSRPATTQNPAEQLFLPFDRQFYLTNNAGTVSVRVRRPAGQLEVSISLLAAS